MLPTSNMTAPQHTQPAPRRNGRVIDGFIRKMSNLERAFYMVPGMKVPLVARIEGDISPARLERSLDKVRQRHPLLGARVVFDDLHDAWFSTHGVTLPELRVVDRRSDKHWFTILQEMQKLPHEPQQRPMIQYALVRSDTVSDLILLASHSICDGSAMVILLSDIMEFYLSPEAVVEQVFPLQMSDYLPGQRWSLKGLLTRCYAGHCNRRWRKKPHRFTQQDYEIINDAFWQGRQYGAVLLELGPEETGRLHERCHRQRVSIGSAVAASFIAAHEQLEGAFEKNGRLLSIPFDLRRHATQSVGNLFSLCVGTLMFPFDYRQKDSFWDNVRRLNGLVRRKMEKMHSAYLELEYFDPSLLDAFSAFAGPVLEKPEVAEASTTLKGFAADIDNPALAIVRSYAKRVPGTISSNVGKAEIREHYGDLTISRLAIPSIIHEKVDILLLGITIGERMVYTMGFLEEEGNPHKPRSRRFITIRNRALDLLGFPEKKSDKPM
jgi:hypothetical protein